MAAITPLLYSIHTPTFLPYFLLLLFLPSPPSFSIFISYSLFTFHLPLSFSLFSLFFPFNHIIIIISLYESTTVQRPPPTFSTHHCQLLVWYRLLQRTAYLISLSSSVSVLPSCTIPGLSLCYSNSLSSICSCPAHVNISIFIVFKMPSTLICSLIYDVLFLSYHIMPNILLHSNFGHFEVFVQGLS